MEDHEIMTVEEVAAYLRVAERTVYDWANKSEIPCGKLGSAWRFKRSEIEKWVNNRLGKNKKKATPETIGIREALSPERVLMIEAATKREALDALIECISTSPAITDKEELSEGIFHREELMSTGIGLGVAVPHVRLESVKSIVMATAVCRTPIADYASLDQIPVQLVFMIAAGKDQHAEHLKILAAISKNLKEEDFRNSLMDVKTPLEFYKLLTGE